MSTGEVFSCSVGGWLDNGPEAAGPGSRTVSCSGSGDLVPQNHAHRITPHRDFHPTISCLVQGLIGGLSAHLLICSPAQSAHLLIVI